VSISHCSNVRRARSSSPRSSTPRHPVIGVIPTAKMKRVWGLAHLSLRQPVHHPPAKRTREIHLNNPNWRTEQASAAGNMYRQMVNSSSGTVLMRCIRLEATGSSRRSTTYQQRPTPRNHKHHTASIRWYACVYVYVPALVRPPHVTPSTKSV